MKNIIQYTIAGLIFCLFTGFVQDKNIGRAQFHVSGICAMCESTIENAVDVKGVIAADYNLETGILDITFKLNKISEEQIHQLINEAGYDTEKSKASDEQYSRVHSCCKYRETGKH